MTDQDQPQRLAALPELERDYGTFMTPGEVAKLLRVDAKTVGRWAKAGRIGSIRTPGGWRRYSTAEIRAILSGTAK